jgi:PAS domain S-box-containing protein
MGRADDRADVNQAGAQRNRRSVDATPAAVFVVERSADGPDRILDVNERATQLFGVGRDGLLAAAFDDLCIESDAGCLRRHTAHLGPGEEVTFETVQRAHNGRDFPVEAHARRVCGAGFDELVVFCRDISRQRRQEARLAEQQLQLELAARASQIGFWHWDLSDDTVRFSAEWKAQIGYAEHEVPDDFGEWRRRVHPDDLPAAMEAVERHIAGDLPIYESHFRFRHRDGSYRWIYARGQATRDDRGKPTRFAGCHVDLTAQRDAEEERVALAQRMGTLQRLETMGTLAGGIAHDFNNILSIISGNVELAMMESQDPELVECLTEIRKAGERARSLVGQITALSRNEDSERRHVSLSDVVQEAVRLVRATAPKRVAIACEIQDDAPGVRANPEQLHQVLVNLATNAWHAIGERPGRVTFRVHRGAGAATPAGMQPSDEQFAVCEVADDGDGIPEELRGRIFEPFFTTKHKGVGTGLGLSVVRGIVKQHGGSVEVRSELGEGTTFRIVLPIAEPPAAARDEGGASAPEGSARVLLADDEARLLRVTCRSLERLGFAVTAVASADLALEALRADPSSFDVMITDLDMPGTDGIAAASAARELAPDLPIILCSGYLEADKQARAKDAGVTDFAAKPILATDLAVLIRKVLESRQR